MCNFLSYKMYIKIFRTSDLFLIYIYIIRITYMCHIHRHTLSFHIPKCKTSGQSVKAMFYLWMGIVSMNWWDNQFHKETYPRRPHLPPSLCKRLSRIQQPVASEVLKKKISTEEKEMWICRGKDLQLKRQRSG